MTMLASPLVAALATFECSAINNRLYKINTAIHDIIRLQIETTIRSISKKKDTLQIMD